ncbi:hypothetical protein ASPTUDRAFT_577883 [Aspergillus tubingensis CBS 134.48]|uniref:Uncharacterized protein n=1 Tax=Aspergillus tubingensis (strain CBS 134.48) TaxID=767770 RepID=A0A1L9N8E1_ASPTC|nr:hypothetical protein ASPTUDRAFT_577883 [Aspergillus tubingensis CBS 134.48]
MCGRVCVGFCYSSTMYGSYGFNDSVCACIALLVHQKYIQLNRTTSSLRIPPREAILPPHSNRGCPHNNLSPEPRLLPPCCEWLTGLHDLDKFCSSHTRMHNGRHFRGSSPRRYIHRGMSVSFCKRKYAGIETSVARLGLVRTYLLRDCR